MFLYVEFENVVHVQTDKKGNELVGFSDHKLETRKIETAKTKCLAV